MTTDYYDIAIQYTEEQKLIQESTKSWVNRFVLPRIKDCYQESRPIPNITKELAAIGAFGLIIPEKFGGMGADYISYGLMMQELERGDTSVRVMSSIQTSLVMYAILTFGSEAQKEKYLPKLANGDYLGAFGLTEPNFGSNIAGMHCHFKSVGDSIILNGSKMWIGNSTTCDIAIVWAKDENNDVRGIIVETDSVTNFNSSLIENKWSFRTSKTGELIFSESELPKSQILPKSKTIKDAYQCLNIGRYAVAWGSIGIALDCYETALKYSQERIQFGQPIASKQLIQKKLAEMITEITKAQLLCYQLGKLMNNDSVNYRQISMAKRNNVQMAQVVAKEARQILGGMGITGEYPVMRHIMNLETLITYQGTHEMHLLITGRDITGIDAI
tara:strand:+ start:1198 stop:2358 length:1161 start_codon:yes stop_codon:yes gene_type:complete